MSVVNPTVKRKRFFLEKNTRRKLIIASRQSRLALWQAVHVSAAISLLYPQYEIDILGMTTRGDQILDRALSAVGGKGLFVKELETALADGRADLAVHSLKDVPFALPDGFVLAAILEREDPRDAFISNSHASLEAMPAGAVIGTGSLRRQAAIAVRYPHLRVLPLRGNVDTRLAKLDRGEFDAIILAAAGLKRLGLDSRIRAFIETDLALPAAGQGALAIEIRHDRDDLRALLAPLNHRATVQAVTAERTVSALLGGSCQVPLAAHADLDDGRLRLRAMLATPDGSSMIRAEAEGAATEPEALGKIVAESLLAQGGAGMMAMCAEKSGGDD
ncbi:MAG: hydroxymethylbilane synthase [Burkholderiaceae bacterium]|nr:hydroxymethylbilane synthase [Burkholderiaceae bacterium]